LADVNYHQIFEALFECCIADKQVYFGGKKNTAATAASRLLKCAEALRLAVQHSTGRLKRKTLLAVIGHITQTLPGRDGDFVQPLLKDYVRSITAILAHQPNVEQLATRDGDIWQTCVDFSISGISRYLENVVRDPTLISRASPAPGTAQGQSLSLTHSSGRSGSNTAARTASQMHRSTLLDLIQCLYYLARAPNAPLHSRAKEVSDAAVHVLQIKALSLGQIQQFAFATINILLPGRQLDDLTLGKVLASNLIPLICHWWQSRAVSKDEMLNSLRDEMLKSLFFIHLHLEQLTVVEGDQALRRDLEDLAEALSLEYSRWSARDQLHIDDLMFGATLPQDYFQLQNFGLRPHNVTGERKWAVVQSLALLERILIRSSSSHRAAAAEDDQPRKKRKTSSDTDRLRDKLSSGNTEIQKVSLQVLPFLVETKVFNSREILGIIPDLLALVTDKDHHKASWAMISCARWVVY
jgi:serine-protein kinase ATM